MPEVQYRSPMSPDSRRDTVERALLVNPPPWGCGGHGPLAPSPWGVLCTSWAWHFLSMDGSALGRP